MMDARTKVSLAMLVGVVVMLIACGDNKSAAPGTQVPALGDSLQSGLETQLPEDVYQALLKPFTGDFDEMIKRRLIRIGVTFNRTFYFVDKGVQRGVAYEYGRLVEERINKALKTSGK